MKYWETQKGDEIAYNKLKSSHLLNILKWIERRATNGMTVINGGMDVDGMPDWYEEYEVNGQEVLDMYDYKGLMREAKKRGLVKDKKISKKKV